MEKLLGATASVVGEVADYLKQESENLQHRKDPSFSSEADAAYREDLSGAAPAAAADGSGDSLYGPQGMNVTAPDLGKLRQEAEGEAGEAGGAAGQWNAASEGRGQQPDDLIQGVPKRIAEGASELKERFGKGFEDARDRVSSGEGRSGGANSGSERASEPEEIQVQGGGVEISGGRQSEDDEGSLQETLRAAKARLDAENELLKQRFHEGYRGAQGLD